MRKSHLLYDVGKKQICRIFADLFPKNMEKQQEAIMRKPTLVIMAAGMGSRFGGLKQIEPVDGHGQIIMDYSLYDAKRAGFESVLFIIKHEIEADFRERIGKRMERQFDVRYCFQELSRLPDGFSVPQNRVKPWGTGHAIACIHDQIDGPFAVINADDYYGVSAIASIYDFLKEDRPASDHAMVGYRLRNTVTDNGHVARGICTVEDGILCGIQERTHIEKRGVDAEALVDGKREFLPGDTMVSMNLWGFQKGIAQRAWEMFGTFLRERTDLDKGEFFLPSVVDAARQDGTGRFHVLPTSETWFGVTYREDLPGVVHAFQEKKNAGIYPDRLWED